MPLPSNRFWEGLSPTAGAAGAIILLPSPGLMATKEFDLYPFSRDILLLDRGDIAPLPPIPAEEIEEVGGILVLHSLHPVEHLLLLG